MSPPSAAVPSSMMRGGRHAVAARRNDLAVMGDIERIRLTLLNASFMVDQVREPIERPRRTRGGND